MVSVANFNRLLAHIPSVIIINTFLLHKRDLYNIFLIQLNWNKNQIYLILKLCKFSYVDINACIIAKDWQEIFLNIDAVLFLS